MRTQSLCEGAKSSNDDYSRPSIEVINLEGNRLITASPGSGSKILPPGEENPGEGYWL